MADKPRASQEELLKRMKITHTDFEDYCKKITEFVKILNEDEKEFYYRNNGRTSEQIAKSLGPDVSVEDVEKLFRCAPHHRVLLAVSCCRNPPPG